MKTVIRVGEKNNYCFTPKEEKELKKYEGKGLLFVNSNSFPKITKTYPSFITVNPYLKTELLKGDLSNVKALRVKVWLTEGDLNIDCASTLAYADQFDIPVLLTFQRFISKSSMEKYNADKDYYTHSSGYYRPNKKAQNLMYHLSLKWVRSWNVYLCDSKGKGCPACMNCSKLAYGIKRAELKSLNLSISGKKDKRGKQGLCKYNCPDCWAKRVTFSFRPQCDKIITNRKQTGKFTHN